MPRPLRIEFQDAWYHIMNRGAGYKDIFKTEKHRLMFLDLLAEATSLFGIRIHAYCLMNNHYHLLINTPRANLSRAMRHINGLYTQRFNRSVKRDGPLFRGRYKAIVVDKNGYLLQVSRYIHRNPVAAKICAAPQSYKWSSCRYYCGGGNNPTWLRINEILSMQSSKNKQEGYKKYVNEELDKPTAVFFKKENISTILGDKSFKANLLNRMDNEEVEAHKTDYNRTRELPTIAEINTICSRYFKITEKELCLGVRGKANDYRKIGMYACRIWGMVTLREIAEQYGCRSHGNITHAVNDIKRRIGKDKKVMLILKDLERKIIE